MITHLLRHVHAPATPCSRTCYAMITRSLYVNGGQIESLTSRRLGEQPLTNGKHEMRIESVCSAVGHAHHQRVDAVGVAHGRGVQVQRAVSLELLQSVDIFTYHCEFTAGLKYFSKFFSCVRFCTVTCFETE